MNHRAVVGITCLSVLLSACGGDEAAAKKAVLGSLKDPDSAKFGKFSLAGERGACLTVNAKNSMGGYTGDQQAYLFRGKETGWMVIGIEADLSHDLCIKLMSAKK